MELCSPHLQPMNPACELSHCLSWAGLCSTAKAQIPWAEQDRVAVSPQPAQCQGCSATAACGARTPSLSRKFQGLTVLSREELLVSTASFY